MFSLADSFINQIIYLKKPLIEAIKVFIKESSIVTSELIESINQSYFEFERHLKHLLLSEPIPKEIIGINFGLFESSDGFQYYISGSKEWNQEDSDWACNNDYFPDQRYFALDIYKKLASIIEDDLQSGYPLAIGVSALFITQFVHTNENILSNGINISTGFDDGDLHHVGRITKKRIATN